MSSHAPYLQRVVRARQLGEDAQMADGRRVLEGKPTALEHALLDVSRDVSDADIDDDRSGVRANICQESVVLLVSKSLWQAGPDERLVEEEDRAAARE